jgi:ABC-type Fe2+-enterobactin transport system substrate-binding protein
VFNVKKRSWKGGIQVDVAIAQNQIDSLSADVDFSSWLGQTLTDLPDEARPSYQERARELFIQAVCWCKLDLAIASGITQENQRLTDDSWIAEVNDSVRSRRNFITSYIASELDLRSRDTAAS